MFEELGRNLDSLVRRMTTANVTEIEPKTDPISVPYPQSTAVKLLLEIGVGRLNVMPGADLLAEGTATYNVQEWAPEISVEGGRVAIKQGHGWPLWPVWGNLRNEWDLRLGTTNPFELRVSKGVAEGTLRLGGIPLTTALIDIGAGRSTIIFDDRNPQQADRFEFKTGAGELTASGLLNTNTGKIVVKGGTGKVALAFDGEALTQDLFADIDLGVGEAHITIKPDVPVRVSMSQGLGGTNVIGNFKPAGQHIYETPDFATTTAPKLTLKVGTGVGSVRVSNTF